jgi:hypothetical protein
MQSYLNCSKWCSYTYHWEFTFQCSGSKLQKQIFKNKEFYGREEQKKQRDIRAFIEKRNLPHWDFNMRPAVSGWVAFHRTGRNNALLSPEHVWDRMEVREGLCGREEKDRSLSRSYQIPLS